MLTIEFYYTNDAQKTVQKIDLSLTDYITFTNTTNITIVSAKW